VNGRRGKPDNHSILRRDAWDLVAKMLFPAHDLVRTYDRDCWLIERYPAIDNPYKHQPASLLPGGIRYLDSINFAPKELIAEIDQAYFRQSLWKKVSLWFTRRGFDLNQRTIPKHLFEAAVQAGFGKPLSEPVKPSEKGVAKAKSRKAKSRKAKRLRERKYPRYATDDALAIEGVNGIESSKWANPWQAAQALAPRAEGSETSKVHRLHKKMISKHLESLETSRNK
jgi:hypothetical protein